LHLACRQLGMTIEEAITALTWNAACSLRMATVAGSLEPGKQADLVMIDAGDYRELADRPGHNDIHMVLRGGRPIYRRSGLLAF
jgi:imidazolonepropionase